MPIVSKYSAFIYYTDDTALVYTIKQQDFNNPQQLAAKIIKAIQLQCFGTDIFSRICN